MNIYILLLLFILFQKFNKCKISWLPIFILHVLYIIIYLSLKFNLNINYNIYYIIYVLMLASFSDIIHFEISSIIYFILTPFILNFIINNNINFQPIISLLFVFTLFLLIDLFIDKVLKKDLTFGGADYKLFFMLSTTLSIFDNITFLLTSMLIGIIIGLIYKIFFNKNVYPFIPAITLGYILIWIL